MEKNVSVSDDWIRNWQASVAVKITAAVLYAIVTIGFTVTVVSLHNVEKSLIANYSAHADRLAYQLGSFFDQNPEASPGEIELKTRHLMKEFDMKAVDISVGNQTIAVGRKYADSYMLDRKIKSIPTLDADSHTTELRISYPPLEKTVTQYRHKWFIGTGIVTLFSGFFLVMVIRIFITRPITALIDATKAVSAGNIETRIAVNRKDEFGYLSIFFNQMMDKILSELTVRRQAEESLKEREERLITVMDSMLTGIVIIDAETFRIDYVNPAAVDMIGAPRERIIGTSCRDYISMSDGKCPVAECGETFDRKDCVLKKPDGKSLPILKSVTSVTLNGRPHFIESIIDITERKRAEEQITHMAYYDHLTQLPNRFLFTDRLHQAISLAERNGGNTAILFLDLDNFKRINDTLGHRIGDLLLTEVARRLSASARKTDTVTHAMPEASGITVARLGGDEFTILLSEIKDPIQDVLSFVNRIFSVLSRPFVLEGHEVFITTSIGISIYPYDGKDIESLLKNADIAMYHAKEKGKNNFQLYGKHMNYAALEKLKMESELRKALESNQFTLYYQPLINVRSGKCVGMEALVRWSHPTRGLILPAEFIHIAEETGIIIPISEWILKTACAQNRLWQLQGLPLVPVSINLPSLQFKKENFIDVIRQVVTSSGLDPKYLVLEITENAIMHDAKDVVETLHTLKDTGIRLSIDDFGTGYSSLSYLKRFPVHALKIDRSFIHEISIDQDNATIVKAIMAMAHSLNLKVIAEGVETEDQLLFLSQQGCDEAQGFFISYPLPADEFSQLLEKEKSAALAVRSRH